MVVRLVVDNIINGRNRAVEILNMLSVEDGEVMYGERNGGIGYCPFWFTINNVKYVATVRTASKDYIKLDKRLIDTNRSAAQDYDLEHILILGFNWNKTKQIYLIKDLDKYLSHKTPVRGYLVFKKQDIVHTQQEIGGVECGGNGSIMFL